jgi:tripartite-type tricarboxylate transporter receptor subunit TctC
VLGSSFGLIGPAGLPPAIVARVHGAVRHALADPQAASRLQKQGAIPVGSTPQQHAEFTRAEIAKWIRVARAAGIAAH